MKKSNLFKMLLLLFVCSSMVFAGCDRDDQDYSNQDGTYDSDSDSDSGSSYSDYVFYESVRALKITDVDNDVSNTSYETIDIYKKGSNYYYKRMSNTYCPVHYNSDYEFLGVNVGSYDNWSLYVASFSVSYYYFYDL